MSHFWEKDKWEQTDSHLLRLDQMPFRRSHPPIPKSDGLYFIRGPRQIGKSSYLKMILSHYAKENPKDVAFLYCDELASFKDLRAAIDPYKGRSILILDEISFVSEWWRTIKALADQNTFRLVVITGSNTWDIKHGADLMPGRFGAGGEIEILPMDFFEFKKAYSDAKFKKCSEEELLKKYLWTGGFPIALAETQGTYESPSKSIETIKRWLLGDAIKMGKNETYLRDILFQIAITQQTPLSLQRLSQKSQMGSHHTAIDYVSLLDATFCMKTLHAYDINRNVFQYKKDKKFYFRDPLYFHLAYHWSSLPLPSDYYEKMAEAAAFEFLQKKHPRLGFIHTQKGEVDFIIPGESAVEVKWSNTVQNLSKTYKELIISKKEVWYPRFFFGEDI